MRYRRSTTPGATYFFTVVTYRRRAMLCKPDTVALLREAFATVKQRHPFRIDAVVILPDHWHGLWTLPPDDADDSTRWRLIKPGRVGRRPPSLSFTAWERWTLPTLHPRGLSLLLQKLLRLDAGLLENSPQCTFRHVTRMMGIVV